MEDKKLNQRQLQFWQALPESWRLPLQEVCESAEIDHLIQFLQARQAAGAITYPSKNKIFAALRATPFDSVKVVIVGQDPYHNPGQAEGLSFSVPEGVPLPPSLKNIFKELHSDLGIVPPKNGHLIGWARQGVLLLNAILTVEEGKPAAHANQGWEFFTDAIITQLIKRPQPLVLMLWGAYAQKKVQNLHLKLNVRQDLVLKAAHPSPLSVRGFLGCRHFSQANQFLRLHHIPEINFSQINE